MGAHPMYNVVRVDQQIGRSNLAVTGNVCSRCPRFTWCALGAAALTRGRRLEWVAQPLLRPKSQIHYRYNT
jgi:hypothetical protein